MFRSWNLTKEFRKDYISGDLPQVSFVIAPAWLSEHAQHHPVDGQELSSKLVHILQENPDMYAKTAFILNYDEGG